MAFNRSNNRPTTSASITSQNSSPAITMECIKEEEKKVGGEVTAEEVVVGGVPPSTGGPGTGGVPLLPPASGPVRSVTFNRLTGSMLDPWAVDGCEKEDDADEEEEVVATTRLLAIPSPPANSISFAEEVIIGMGRAASPLPAVWAATAGP